MSNRARLAVLAILILPIPVACSGGRKSVEAGASHPYGVNNWRWPLSTCGVFRDAHLDRYRVMVNWKHFEPSPDVYDWRLRIPG